MKNMKKLAIMGSGNGGNFQAIVKRLKSREDIEIICLSDIEDSFILKRAQILGIDYKYLPKDENLEYFRQNKFDLIALAGYMQILSEDVLRAMGRVVNIHPSLLPSFKGKDAIKQAFMAGVKVSGISIHWVEKEVDSGKIIAQYPVFITNDMHLDELEEEIHCIEHKLYPVVIEKLLEDKVFDFQDLMKSSCNNRSDGGSCGSGGCGGKCSGG